MEVVRSRKRTFYIVGALTVLILVIGGIVWQNQKTIRRLLPSSDGVPTLGVVLERKNSRGRDFEGPTRLLTDPSLVPPECQLWQGYDDGRAYPPKKKNPSECGQYSRWQFVRHPVAYSMVFNHVSQVIKWVDDLISQPLAMEDPLGRGLLGPWKELIGMEIPKLRSTDMGGVMGKALLEAVLKSRGRIDFDVAHGRKGLVLSFDDLILAKSLDLSIGMIAERRYSLLGQECGIWEFRLGPEKVFSSLCLGRMFVGLHLTALLNVMDQEWPGGEAWEELEAHGGGEGQVPGKGILAKADLTVLVHSPAFLDRLMPFLVPESPRAGNAASQDAASAEAPQYSIGVHLSLKPLSESPSLFHSVEVEGVSFPPSPLWDMQQKKINPLLWEVLPGDVTAFFATSHSLMPYAGENSLVKGLARSWLPLYGDDKEHDVAMAIVWDWNYQDEGGEGQVGLVMIPHESEVVDSWVGPLAMMVGDEVQNKVAYCRKGQVILLASSPMLLYRMKESCEGRSVSLGDAINAPPAVKGTMSSLAYFNRAGGLRELLYAGGAHELPTAKQGKTLTESQKKVRDAQLKMTERTLAMMESLPVLLMAGEIRAGKDLKLEPYTASWRL